ncbi:hypothetical protein Pint_12264 [Pistacia integerrima]|uniref:Uncharacterized protein n=1 Tax=Pistacia integerrima TaxID=434235 RepID=A0ACC0XIJ7_9ROSI|nr:hypothetical protein Pint_12264 [Pistacia integerrima]
MMMNNLPSSRSGKGLSIQTCFPEIKSVVNSTKSSGEDDTGELVNVMTPDGMALQNKAGNIVASGISKNKKLPPTRGSEGATPLCMAILLGHREMVQYLYSITKDTDLKDEDRIELLVAVINTGLYSNLLFSFSISFSSFVKVDSLLN